MKRLAILCIAVTMLMLLVLSASAVAAPASPIIEVTGSGVVPLSGGGTATVTVSAQTVGRTELLTVPDFGYQYWQGRARGFVTIVVAEGITVKGQVKQLSTMYEIARGVSIDFNYRGTLYSMYITEDYDRSGDGVWFNFLGMSTAGAPADLTSGGFDLNYTLP